MPPDRAAFIQYPRSIDPVPTATATDHGPPRQSLKHRTLRASMWTMIGYGAGQVLRLGSNLLLTRLLFPEAFGLMALVQVFMQGLKMFSDIGIGPAIVQHERGDDPVFLNTAWTIQIMRGAMLALSTVPLGWAAAHLYEVPALRWLLPLAGLGAAIAGFTSTSLFTLNRKLVVKHSTLLALIAQVVSIVVMVGWAYFHRSVMALIAGGLAAAGVRVLLSHLWLPGIRNSLCWDRDAARQLFTFGKWIFISTLITFLAMQLDRILLGRLIPLDLLGVYSVAFMLAMMPYTIGVSIFQNALYPALALKARQDPQNLSATLQRIRQLLLPVSLLLALGIVYVSPAFFTYLYDDRYLQAGWIAQMLALYVWFMLLQGSVDRVLVALGDTRALAVSNGVNVALTAVACLAGYHFAGLPGFLLGLCISSLGSYLMVQHALRRHGIFILREDLLYTTSFLGLAGLGVAGAKLLSSTSGAHVYANMSLGVGLFVLIPLAVWALRRAVAAGLLFGGESRLHSSAVAADSPARI